MPSTFTTNTGIEKPGDGEQAGLWGETVNLSSDIIDRALNGSTSVALTSTSYTLTTAGGTLSEGQYAAVTFTGTPGGTATVTVAPSTAQKTYFIRNSTDQSVVITQGSGGNATIAAGRSAVVVCTGVGASSAVFDVTAVMNTATSANTANAVVQRDGSGGFSAAAISGTTGTFSGNLTVDTNTLFVDVSANTVGIGTSTPAYGLDVMNTSSGTVARVSNGSSGGSPSVTHGEFVLESDQPNMGIQLLGTATSNQRILFGDPGLPAAGSVTYDHTNNYMAFNANNAERVRITSAGYVGIGTTTPEKTFHVNSSSADPVVISRSGGTDTNTSIQWKQSATSWYSGVNDDLSFAFKYNSADLSTAPDLVIDSSGRLGIGTNSPSAKLDVVGGAAIGGTASNQPLTLTSTDALSLIGFEDGTTTSVVNVGASGDDAVLRTGGVERMRVLGTGNVGIGTGSATEKLEVVGTVKATGLNLSGTAVTATAAELNYTDGVTSNIQTQLNGKASTSTSVSAGSGLTGGGTLASSRTISHADTSSQGSVNNSGATVIQDVTLDTYGHVTALGSATISLSTLGVTATAAELNKLDGVTATTAELNYTDGVTSNIQTQLNGKASTASHATSVWEAGTNTTATIVSPANVRAAVESRAIGDGQQWYSDGALTSGTAYQNTNGRAIQVMVSFNGAGNKTVGFSTNGSTWVDTLNMNNDTDDSDVNASFIVPAGHYWRVVGAWTVSRRNVLR